MKVKECAEILEKPQEFLKAELIYGVRRYINAGK